MAGATLSSTTIVCTQVPTLPQSSVADHVRVIVLSCGQIPPTVISLKVIPTTGSQLSVAVAVPVLAGNVLAVHRIVTLPGQVTIGATLSTTVIVWVHVCTFPALSVTVNTLVIISGLAAQPVPPLLDSTEVVVKLSQN